MLMEVQRSEEKCLYNSEVYVEIQRDLMNDGIIGKENEEAWKELKNT